MNKEPNKKDLQKSEKYYSEDGLFDKIKKYAFKAGADVVFRCLLLYGALTSSKTPLLYRSIIVGALGYFISPIDLVPDLIPVVGYLDDLAALTSVLLTLNSAGCIDKSDRDSAKEQLSEWFDEDQIDGLDDV